MDLPLIAYLPVLIFGVVAVCFWLAALILFIRAIVIGSKGVRVPGLVTGYNDFHGRHGRRMYSAIYEARVPDGRTLRCTSGIATSWQSPPVGTVVTLSYRADDPEKPLVTLGFSRFLWCTVIAGVAVMVTIPTISVFLSLSHFGPATPDVHPHPAATHPSKAPSHH